MSIDYLSPEQADEYALGALEPDEDRRVALHLLECDPCRLLVERAQDIAAMLALTTPLRRPPQTLRRRVFEGAGLARPGLVSRLGRVASVAAVVAAVGIALAALTGMVSLRGQVRDLREANVEFARQLVDAESQKVEIAALTQKLSEAERATSALQREAKRDQDLLLALMSPNSDVAGVFAVGDNNNAVGSLVWDREQKRVWFVANGLVRLSSQETYQIWAKSGESFVSLGTFNADETGFAYFHTYVPLGLQGYDGAVVTVERWGDGAEREGPSVFVLDLTAFRQ
jgi:anti-sigma factor RsiW